MFLLHPGRKGSARRGRLKGEINPLLRKEVHPLQYDTSHMERRTLRLEQRKRLDLT
jgi:hypothetical protein